MPEKPVIHQYQVSPFSAKVRRVMHYKNIEFDTVNYGISGAGKIKKLNPRAKAPFFMHEGKMIPDSTNMIEYLESIHPEKPVIPTDPVIKAHAHIIEDWADESLYFYDMTMRGWPNNIALLADDVLIEEKPFMAKLFRFIIPKAIHSQTSAQGIGRKEHQAVCEEMAAHFEAINTLVSNNDWLVGDSLSIADIGVISMCTVLERAEEAKAMMEKLPSLMAWRERVDAVTLPENTPADMKPFV